MLWGFTEKSDFLGGGVTKNQYIYIGGNCLKMGAWTVFRFKGGIAKEESEGGLIPQCTLWC